MKYSLEMARAMAFGVPFNPTKQDDALARKLLDGLLELAPHPAWRIPQDITWYENPFKEANWVAQFHMLRWLDPLRRVAESGNSEAGDLWVRIVTSWIEKNPPGKGRANYTWSDMVEAVRAMTMCFALPMLEAQHPEALETVLNSIEEHGEWLADESHIRTGNHALQQHQGLLVIASVLERDDWRDLAIARAAGLLTSDYDEDGINAEGTPQYHHINFNWWNLVKRRVELVSDSVPTEFQRINRAPLGLAHATRPDGNYELIGDTETFALRGIDHPAVKFVQTKTAQGTAPLERIKVYRSGYVFGRSTWGTTAETFAGASFFSLRFGPQNRIHGHQDGMALTLYANKAPLLVDSGKYAYDARDTMRAYLLSREAHNSVFIAGRDYDKTHSVALRRDIQADGFRYFEFVDNGYKGVRLRRQVLVSLEHKLIVVRDNHDAGDEVVPEQLWHLSPGTGHRKTDLGTIMARGEATRAWFVPAIGETTAKVVQGTRAPIRGWQSKTWRQVEPLRTVSFAVPAGVPGLVTAIDFANQEVEPTVLATDVDLDRAEVALHLKRGTTDFTVAFGDNWGALHVGATSIEEFRRVAREEFELEP